MDVGNSKFYVVNDDNWSRNPLHSKAKINRSLQEKQKHNGSISLLSHNTLK